MDSILSVDHLVGKDIRGSSISQERITFPTYKEGFVDTSQIQVRVVCDPRAINLIPDTWNVIKGETCFF